MDVAPTGEPATEPMVADDPDGLTILRDPLRVETTRRRGSQSLRAEIARRIEVEERLQAALLSEREARTAVERAQRRADFLSAASAALAASLDYAQTLDCVAKLAVPEIADWCVVDLVEPGASGEPRFRRIAVAHAEPAKESLLHQLQEKYPTVESGVPHTMRQVLHSGQSWFDAAVSPVRLAAESRDTGHLELMRALGFAAEMVVPLTVRDCILGTITLVGDEGRSYDRDDLLVAEELARRCAMAIANAQAFAAEEAARQAAQRAAERTQHLQEITGQLSRSLVPDQVLATIARSAADLLCAPVGAVFLLDRGDPDADFILAAAHGIDEGLALELRLPRHASLAGRTIDEGRTLVVDDVREEAGTALPAMLTGTLSGSEIAAPIHAGDLRLGVVKAFSPTVRTFSPEDADVLTTLANAAAVALTHARLYREAQDAIRTRDEFLSAAAHDLRTPLTSMKGLAQLMRRWMARPTPPSTERLVGGLARIDASATKMSEQLEELLDLTRLQMGHQLELRRAPLDLVELVRRVVAEQEQVSGLHSIRIDTDQVALEGHWDGIRLGRVLENMLSNAIKYSPAGGDIVVRLTLDEGEEQPMAVLSVVDQGLGIPAADLPSIFDRFRRASNVAGRIGGTGIGLASARQIVGQHGGSIQVQSVEGSGSTFTVRLPVVPVPGPASSEGSSGHDPADALDTAAT